MYRNRPNIMRLIVAALMNLVMLAVSLPVRGEQQGKTEAGPHGDFIFELDAIVGQIMATLDDLGIDNNTLVMFSSDNGPSETTNLYYKHPDIVKELKALLETSQKTGRSAPLGRTPLLTGIAKAR